MRNGLGAPPVFRGRFYNSGSATRRKSPFRGVGLGSQWMMKGQVNGMGWLTRLSGMNRRGAALNGLGITLTAEEFELYLDHSHVPRVGGVVRHIPAISTPGMVRKYASDGFHVSVDQGLQARNNDIKLLWARAAYAYWAVYDVASRDANMSRVEEFKRGLRAADQIANTARSAMLAQGNLPPSAPSTAQPSPTQPSTMVEKKGKSSNAILWILGLGTVGILGGAILLSSKKRKT